MRDGKIDEPKILLSENVEIEDAILDQRYNTNLLPTLS